jgi:hypothetical protein
MTVLDPSIVTRPSAGAAVISSDGLSLWHPKSPPAAVKTHKSEGYRKVEMVMERPLSSVHESVAVRERASSSRATERQLVCTGSQGLESGGV